MIREEGPARPAGPHELGLEVLAALPRPLVLLAGSELSAEPGAEDREEDVPQFVLQFDHLPSPCDVYYYRAIHIYMQGQSL